MKLQNQKNIDKLINKVLNETLESKAETLETKLKKGLEIDDHGENHDPISVIDSLHRRKHITKREHTDLEKKIRDAGYLESNDYEKPYQHVTSFLKKKGIDHLHYTNRVEDSKSESKSYMIVDPKTSLRPIFQKKKGIVNVKRTER